MSWWPEDPSNETDPYGCDGNLRGPSCVLTPSATAVWDTIAGLRMIVSCLSLLGASSVIGSAIQKKEVGHPKVLPIFSLAVADLLLALLWIIGGALWLRGIEDRKFCFAVSLFTVILVCVSVNLTVVYASVSYSIIKKTDLSGLLTYMDPSSMNVWSKAKTALIYSTAWGLPVVLVLGLFGVVAGSTGIIQKTDLCSCWCAPVLSNVMPYAIHKQEGTAKYVHDMRKLVVVYGVVIITHFLVGLVALATLYFKCLKWIRQLKNKYDPSQTSCIYGSDGRGQRWALISRGESKARKRVFYFLTIFIISGFFNFVFTLGVMVHEIEKLRKQETLEMGKNLSFEKFYMVFATLQAVSITQQGFLNAIVYGWTRENFIHTLAMSGGGGSSVHQLMFRHRGENKTASDELGETWAMEEEEEGEEKWTPSQTQSITPPLPHKVFLNTKSS